MRRVALLVLALAGCSGPNVRPHADAAVGSSGEPGDELAFEEEAAEREAGGAGVEVGGADARSEVEASVAAVRAMMDAERLRLDQRKAEVDAAATELEARLSTISALEKRLEERLGRGETARKRRAERITVLAKLIVSMPPTAAAAMVGQMSDEDAQALVLEMSRDNERKASKLLSAMPGERAAQLGQLYLDEDPRTLEAADPAKEAEDEDPTRPGQ